MRDVVVIGAGLAGLSAAIRLAKAGKQVDLITKGLGGIQLGQGSVDLLGYAPDRVTNPVSAIDELVAKNPKHPYAKLGSAQVGESAKWLADLLGEELLVGSPDKNFMLPTAIGAVRPTCYAQPSMISGEVTPGKKYVIVGLRRLKDFYPQMVAGNLEKAELPGGGKVSARFVWVDVPVRGNEADSSGLVHARALDNADFREKFCAAIKPLLQDDEVVGLPAVLGLKDLNAWRDIAASLGHEVFEIPIAPPSIPGMRINEKLTEIVRGLGVRYNIGAEVVDFKTENGRIASITFDSAGHPTTVEAENIIYAPGGFESGALRVDSYYNVTERAFNLPLVIPEGKLLNEKYWGPQPLFEVGVGVDEQMRVLDGDKVLYSNLFAAGGIISGATRWRDKSGEGIALASALRAAETILGESR